MEMKPLKDRINSAMNWCKENKDVLVVIVPAAVTGVACLCKVGGKLADVHKEHNHQNLTCYDRSLGHYWQLKRELGNDEWIAIEQRRKNGERLADILSEMKVLK